ncbi:MAG TPA: carbamoyltransferase HypF [Bacteroidales bacterium]|nr:carbamoyltransferase HypF [Bacteroidales bacterium]
MPGQAFHIKVRGLVQGVGFRPFVYRIAHQHGIKGWVENNNEGVTIHAQGDPNQLSDFIAALQHEAPVAASISRIDISPENEGAYDTFIIRSSSNLSDEVTEVSPDIAVCGNCLHDIQTQPHRKDYLFTNCTHCGPRFTIIRQLPYDRKQTTMAPFVMCGQCNQEYTNILDRRFHAQPVACRHCGPQYALIFPERRQDVEDWPGYIAQKIDEGKILAVKGLGGYHLLCDAHNEVAVRELRRRKQREGKPFAVMMQNPENARKYFEINVEEEDLLLSWRRPVVLVRNIRGLTPCVSNGLHTTGLILPYMPLHHEMFKRLKTDAVVFTSANLSDEPVLIDDVQAGKLLPRVADHIVAYNREIYNRADDSVAMVANGKPVLIRRSRGFTPSPIELSMRTEGIMAAGAELNNVFAIGKGNQVIMSQHIGDLKNAPTLAFFEESFGRFQQLFRFTAEMVACDLHPDYLSSVFARQTGLPLLEVQHHHAHMASCMAEHRIQEPVIGIIFDGTGMGTDGTIWGGECLAGDYLNVERIAHLEPVRLPGGDKVTDETWRTAFAYLWQYYGADQAVEFALKQEWCDEWSARNLVLMLENKLNSPLSSGAGRLFDAVSALTGLCSHAAFHAQAPMKLEAAAANGGTGFYNFSCEKGMIGLKPLFDGILEDMSRGLAVQTIAAKFHHTLANIIVDMAKQAGSQTGLQKVVLSGGTFQNRNLLERSVIMLQQHGFEAIVQQKVPSNDGGIALGQLAVAAARRIIG